MALGLVVPTIGPCMMAGRETEVHVRRVMDIGETEARVLPMTGSGVIGAPGRHGMDIGAIGGRGVLLMMGNGATEDQGRRVAMMVNGGLASTLAMMGNGVLASILAAMASTGHK